MVQATDPKTYTAQEYLELEVNSPERHEYVNREIRLMTGGPPDHNTIAGNLLTALKLALRGKPYRVFVTDQRLWIPAFEQYTYPDVMVVEKPLVLQESRTDTVMNPYFIAEVLSSSTANYDRVGKFAAYRTFPTFREYLLVDQYAVHVEHYIRTAPHQWLLSEYNSLEVTLSFEAFENQVKIAELYQDVEFVEQS
ncbi:MAG: Uma2 family endonuclease [Cyanobacteria bacterium P01_H01_bin.153]